MPPGGLAHRSADLPTAPREEAGSSRPDVRSVANVRERVLERQADALHLVGEVPLAEAEQPEPFERRDPLRRRRQLADRRRRGSRAERLDPARLVAGEVLLVEPRARRDRLGDGAAVERVRARLAIRRAWRRARVGRAPGSGPGRARGARRSRPRAAVPGRPRTRSRPPRSRRRAAASRPRRPKRSASAAQPATAPGTVTDRGPNSSTGSSGSARAAPGRRRRARGAARRPRPARRGRRRSRRHRLGDAEDRRGRERRVDRVAAPLEGPQAGARLPAAGWSPPSPRRRRGRRAGRRSRGPSGSIASHGP